MKTATSLLGILCLVLITQTSFADKEINHKFGKISMDEMENQFCPIDSNAYAYYIFDEGRTQFKYAESTIRSNESTSSQKGFQLYFNRHIRLKILKNEGFDYGDFSIPLFVDGSDKEKVVGLKAYTYNLVDGKIEKTKVRNEDCTVENSTENWQQYKFAMPNLKEGCIIEIEYEIVSDFIFNLQEWYFQRSIPVMESSYEVFIPEYFHYNQNMRGYFPVITTSDRRQNKFSLTYIQQAEGMISQSSKYTQEIEYTEYINRYVAEEIPAFPDEKFLHTAENYLSKVEFELAFTRFPNSPEHYYTTSWEAIDEKLTQHYNFGRELNKTGHLKEAVAALKSTGLEEYQLLAASLSYMQHAMSWNGNRGYYTTNSAPKAFKDGEGNCADVNLNLVILLNELGFNASPMLLSTQDHGIILLGRPSLTRFNYVVAYVEIGDKYCLLDATDPNSFVNLLPVRCLNDQGRVIGKTGKKWVPLQAHQNYITKSFALLELDQDMHISGQVKKRLQGYAAYSFKHDASQSTSLEDFKKEFEEENKKITISDLEIPDLDSIGLNIRLSYKIDDADVLMNAGEMVYMNASIDPFFEENPFKLEKREFPVEFDYPLSIQQNYTVKIPENLEVSEIPEAINLTLPNASGSFTFMCVQQLNTLQVNTQFSIAKDIFLPSEYEDLKNFIQAIIEKQNEMVVFKTKTI